MPVLGSGGENKPGKSNRGEEAENVLKGLADAEPQTISAGVGFWEATEGIKWCYLRAGIRLNFRRQRARTR